MTLPTQPQIPYEDYVVNVGPQGTFRRSGNYQTRPEHIDLMFQKFLADQNLTSISIYFHGGLVNETSGLESAQTLADEIRKAGSAPVCFVWETGLLETVGTNLSKLSETKLFNKLLKLLIKKLGAKLGYNAIAGRAAVGQELSDEDIAFELAKPEPFRFFDNNKVNNGGRSAVLAAVKQNEAIINSELERELTFEITYDKEFKTLIAESDITAVENVGGTGGRSFLTAPAFIAHVVKIAYRIVNRVIKKTDHDFFPTIVEEILREFYVAEVGAWVWKSMKDKSDEMWTSNDNLQGDNRHPARYFLDKLIELKIQRPELKINLIGHSAGSIVICNLFRHVAGMTGAFSFNHIILMAPACRIDLFTQEVLKFPGRYKDIRIFTMSDTFECGDIMVPFFYTHSLLYFISGVLEDQGKSSDALILGLERHICFDEPYGLPELDHLHKYIYEEGLNRISFSVFEGTTAGLETAAKKHGDFDNDKSTLRSIVEILKT